MKKKKKIEAEISEEISEEYVYKTYNDNDLINFDVTVALDHGKWFTLINGLPEYGQIRDIDTLKRIIRCLELAENRWEQQLLED
jgi:hypothetical protein